MTYEGKIARASVPESERIARTSGVRAGGCAYSRWPLTSQPLLQLLSLRRPDSGPGLIDRQGDRMPLRVRYVETRALEGGGRRKL